MALSMRSRIWNLYYSLCQSESDKNLIIDNFFKRKDEASDIEGHNLFDIDSFYFKKMENKEIEIFEMLLQRKLSKNDEDRFSNTVKLYYCKTISRYLEWVIRIFLFYIYDILVINLILSKNIENSPA